MRTRKKRLDSGSHPLSGPDTGILLNQHCQIEHFSPQLGWYLWKRRIESSRKFYHKCNFEQGSPLLHFGSHQDPYMDSGYGLRIRTRFALEEVRALRVHLLFSVMRTDFVTQPLGEQNALLHSVRHFVRRQSRSFDTVADIVVSSTHIMYCRTYRQVNIIMPISNIFTVINNAKPARAIESNQHRDRGKLRAAILRQGDNNKLESVRSWSSHLFLRSRDQCVQ